jgi:hypothetical protein
MRLKRLEKDSLKRKLMVDILSGRADSNFDWERNRSKYDTQTDNLSIAIFSLSLILIFIPSIIDLFQLYYGIPMLRKKSEFLADTASLLYTDYGSITFILNNFVKTSENDSQIHPSPQQRLNALTGLANSFSVSDASEKKVEKNEFKSLEQELEAEGNDSVIDIKQLKLKNKLSDNQLQIAKKEKARNTMIYGAIWFGAGVIGLQWFESSFFLGECYIGGYSICQGACRVQ